MIKRLTFWTVDAWRTARAERIGGSDAAALLGLNPYKTNVELWEEKVGLRKPKDISNEPYVQFGHAAEAPLRELFSLDHPQYKVQYFTDNMVLNDKYPFAHASLDGELVELETGRKGVLEIKTTNILQSMQREQWNQRIPDNYYCQVLWYLMVTEYDFAVLKARLKSEWSNGELRIGIRHYIIERKDVEDDIEELRKAGEKMWDAIRSRKKPALILPQI